MSMPGELEQVVSDVNRQLSRDVEDSGRFMTLFLSEVDLENRIIKWVRAGHDPAMMYDAKTNTFDEFSGRGLPLGVFENTSYHTLTREIRQDQVIAIGTDGIWEATNPNGQPFGKERFKDIIQNHYNESAADIVTKVFSELESFACESNLQDDVTLVIIKIED
jgi:sigma-B regulation protein RsbU (phosphoserine phosphatase)